MGSSRRVVTVAVAAALMLVLAPLGSADDTVLVTVAMVPDRAAVGDEVTATITLTSLNHQTPATTLHVVYDPSVLTLVGDDALDCAPPTAGAVDCSVPEMQFSFAYPFRFRVLRAAQTTVSGSDSGASGSGTLNAPPTQFSTTESPVLSGDATVGGTLTTTTGTWSPTYDYTYSYHWNRCTPSNTSCATLNATGATYDVTPADAGCTLTAIVQATAGSTSFYSASAPSPVVQPGRDCTPGPAPSPPPPPPVPPSAPAYSFVSSLPGGTQYLTYQQDPLQCVSASGFCVTPDEVAVVAGSPPPGLRVNAYTGTIVGKPFSPGTYTFTLEARFSPPASVTSARHDYTIVVGPFRSPTGSGPSSQRRLVLPKRTLTPGATNRTVTQQTIGKTICISRWIAKIRPPVSFTNALKVKQMKQYGETGSPRRYQEDHLIPLELGGAPRSARNLWPEPHSQSKRSEPLERALKRKVCAGKVTLAAARKQILAYKRRNG